MNTHHTCANTNHLNVHFHPLLIKRWKTIK